MRFTNTGDFALADGDLYIRHDCRRQPIIGQMRDMRVHGLPALRWGVTPLRRTSARQAGGERIWIAGRRTASNQRRRPRTERLECRDCDRGVPARIGILCALADAAIDAGEDSILVA